MFFQPSFQDIDLEAKHLAIDKPTKKLLQFMWKHYQLSKLVNQGNNFVIFEEFFEEACENFSLSIFFFNTYCYICSKDKIINAPY